MRRPSFPLTLILGAVLAALLTGQSQALRAETHEQLQGTLDAARWKLQSDQEPPEALVKALSSVIKQMKRLDAEIEESLASPDLDEARRRMLLVARNLVQRIIKMLDSLDKMLDRKTTPDSKRILVAPL